jgi:neurotransmitter:Na+ symporter, NSS family
MKLEKRQNKRDGFSTKFGAIAAAAGSAIGLGNIWRFPYIAEKGGGGAFVLIYACFIILIGVSCLLLEFIIGRKSQRDVIGSFYELAPRQPWFIGGWIAVITVVLIFAFYSVVFGWALDYLIKSVSNSFAGKSPVEIADMFGTTTSDVFKPIIYTIIGIGLTTFVVVGGIKKGIEKGAKILMPLLFLFLIILAVRSLMLPNSSLGLAFLFYPDFSKVTSETILLALGQAFFTLSLGSGAMITYGSYIRKKETLASIVIYTCILSFSVSILAGIVIFPAVFSFGIAPSQGPRLAFITLPNIFQQMFGGYIFSVVFFLLIAVAALTSTLSMLEVVVAALTGRKGTSRMKAAIWVSIAIVFLSVPCSLSYGIMSDFKIFGLNTFDLLDYITANFGLTISSMIFAVFVGWFMGSDNVKDELSNSGLLSVKYFSVFMFVVKFVVPVGIIIVFLNSMGFIG